MNFGAIAWGGIILLGVVDGALVVMGLVALARQGYRKER
jgi:hypothetical protein